MFHWPAPTVNGVLVQFPCVWGVGPRRTVTGPVVTGAEVGVDDEELVGALVDVVGADDDAATVVVVAAPLGAAPDSGGSVYEGVLAVCDDAVPDFPEFPMTIPMRIAASPTTTRCQVLHDRRSRIFNSPGTGELGLAGLAGTLLDHVGFVGTGLDHAPLVLFVDSV